MPEKPQMPSTPLPWVWDEDEEDIWIGGGKHFGIDLDVVIVRHFAENKKDKERTKLDFQYIVHAANSLPALQERVKVLEAELLKARQTIHALHGNIGWEI